MPIHRTFLPIAAILCSTFLRADCEKDYRSNPNAGVLISDFTITGTRTLSSDVLGAMTRQLIGSCFNDDSDELGERVRALFQDRGYFAVEVKSIKIKPSDPLAVPKPAVLEAELLEGTRYRLREIKISGNHAFSAERILNQFSLHKGDVFERNKIGSGFESIRELYEPAGFLNMFFVPETRNLSDGTIILTVAVTEGPQYHMGRLEVVARKESAEKLQASWQLGEGSIFDPGYIKKYIADNRSLLPRDFSPESVQVVTNCPDAVVSVRVVVDAFDPKAQALPNNIPCDSSK